MRKAWLIVPMFVLLAGLVMAQRRRGGFGGYGGYGEGGYIPEEIRTAREVPSHSTDTPEWSNPVGFEKDVFTFTRVRRERPARVTSRSTSTRSAPTFRRSRTSRSM